jgi:cell division protease FtsH
MTQRLGAVTFGSNANGALFGADSRRFSEQSAQAIDDEVRWLLDEAYARANQIIVEHRRFEPPG